MPTKIKTTIKSKSQKYKDIVNPVFMRFLDLTLDSFWQDTFVSYAHGKFPKELSYRNSSLIYKKKNAVRCDIEEETEEDLKRSFINMMDFIRGVVKISSPLDNRLKEEEIFKLNSSECLSNKKSWSQIKKVKLKQHLIDNYVQRISIEKRLNSREKSNLEFEIEIGLLFKTINSKNIIFKDKRIQKIIGLEYEEKENEKEAEKGEKMEKGKKENTLPLIKIFSVDRGDLDKIINKKKKKGRKKITLMWDNYLKYTKNIVQACKKLAR